MDNEEQKRYLIRLSRAAVRQLMIYRTFAEMAKKNAGARSGDVNYVLENIQSESSLVTQLGPDFEVFLGEILDGPEGDADQALESFLTNWFPKEKSD